MKIYTWFFVLLTLAEIVFTAAWFLVAGKMDRVVVLGLIIYAAVMLVGYVAWQVEKYRRRRKELIDDLP